MVNKRKKKKLITQISNLLMKEARKQVGCLKALCNQAGNEKAREKYLRLYWSYYKYATCMEVVWNQLLDDFCYDLEEMPTHNVFFEAERTATPQWQAIGRDSGVRAIHQFIKELVSDNDLWESIKPINLFGEADWGDYDQCCPICGQRVFEREREYGPDHADGTANWDWNYSYVTDPCDHEFGVDGYSNNTGYIEVLPREYGNEMLTELLEECDSIYVGTTYFRDGTFDSKIFYTEDNDQVLFELLEILIKKFGLPQKFKITKENISENNFHEISEYIDNKE